MQSLTLLEEIISEFRFHNPNATPQEISEGITAILGKEILPELLKNLSLPEFPSYRSLIISEGSGARGKRKMVIGKAPNLDNRRRAIQGIENVRIKLGWDGGDDLLPKAFTADSASLYLPKSELPLIQEELDEQIREDSDFRKSPDPVQKEAVNGPFQKIPKPIEKNIITFSETTQRKIVSDSLFEVFFKNVEVQLRSIIDTRDLKTEIDVICKTDEEIPSWNKCILKVHPPSNLDFKARMNISTIFDITIRKTINELKKNADGNTLEYLKNLNRNLFVHIDL